MAAATASAASAGPTASSAPTPPARQTSFSASSQRSNKSGSGSGGSSIKGSGSGSGSGNLYSPVQPSSPSAGGILANAHEKPALTKRALSSNSGAGSTIASALKTAFQPPPQAGRQAKKTGAPLGKTFERTTPLGPDGAKHRGAEVLPYDPRGREASAGDGVVPPGRLQIPQRSWRASDVDVASSSTSGRPPALNSNSDFSQWIPQAEQEISSSDEAGPSSPISAPSVSESDSSTSSSRGGGFARSRSTTATTTDEVLRRGSVASTTSNISNTSSAHSCAIRFAPLPSSGRLKRANSITIGVAARSHLLSSQGSARSNAADWQTAQLHAQAAGPSGGGGGGAAGGANNARQAWYNGGAKPDDVVDIGEELRKGALKAWRKMRGNGNNGNSKGSLDGSVTEEGAATLASSSPYSSTSPATSSGASQAGASGDGSPGRQTSSSLDDDDHHQNDHLDGGQPPTFHPADEELGEGAQTPRARRLSTGAFLGSSSLRGMQEDRRKEVLGLAERDGGEKAREKEMAGVEGSGEEQQREEEEEQEGQRNAVTFQEALGETNAGKVAGRLLGFASQGGQKTSSSGQGHGTGGQEESPSYDESSFASDDGRILIDSEEAEGQAEDEDEDEDEDEETREAKALADQAFTAHSERALMAGGIEKQRRSGA